MCPICGATLAQMEIELDGYHDRAAELWGVGITYEGLEPPGAHLLVGAFRATCEKQWQAQVG